MSRLAEQEVTKRRYLSGDKYNDRKQIDLDMEAVYQDIDSGMSIKMVMEKYRVSRSTLYRRHMEYQKQIAEREEKILIENQLEEDGLFPIIPEKFKL